MAALVLSCVMQGLRCGVWDPSLWHTGVVALRCVESSPTRNQTGVPALAGGFLTTGPPGKPLSYILIARFYPMLVETSCRLDPIM